MEGEREFIFISTNIYLVMGLIHFSKILRTQIVQYSKQFYSNDGKNGYDGVEFIVTQ